LIEIFETHFDNVKVTDGIITSFKNNPRIDPVTMQVTIVHIEVPNDNYTQMMEELLTP